MITLLVAALFLVTFLIVVIMLNRAPFGCETEEHGFDLCDTCNQKCK